MYQKITADTVGAAVGILSRVDAELGDALRGRHADGSEQALGRPLRMTIHLALDDLELAGPVSARYEADRYITLRANTVREAKAILGSARERITMETACRPAHRRHRNADQDRPLRVTVQYNLSDLDREGPLSVAECLHIPFEGIPRGLQPAYCHPEYNHRPRSRREPPRRSLVQRLLGF